MRGAGARSGAYVLDATKPAPWCSRRGPPRRASWPPTPSCSPPAPILAKLGSDRHPAHRLESDGSGRLRSPACSPATSTCTAAATPPSAPQSFDRRFYGGGGHRAGARRPSSRPPASPQIKGRIVGDESRFDSLRGGPSSGFGVSVVDLGGPLSALSFDRGLASANGGSIQRNPPLFAAQQLTSGAQARATSASRRVGRRPAGRRRTPECWRRSGRRELAELVRLTLKDVRQLVRRDAAEGPGCGRRRPGHHHARAHAPPSRFARRLGVTVTMNDGSGLSRADQALARSRS